MRYNGQRSGGTAAPTATPESAVAGAMSDEYWKRLERLVRTLIGRRFRTARDLWRLQTRLLTLQRDIQGSISELKRSRGSADELEELRSVRWHARRFGDAIAWTLLGLDRQYIYPLARNSPVPIPLDVHGTRGVQAIAEGLAGDWGFPLLHDITDCLRIGDITFVCPGAEHTTVEVKTKLVREHRATKGRATFEYQATVVSLSQPPPLAVAREDDGGSGPTGLAIPPKPNGRFERQLGRMEVARRHQTAEHGTVNEIDGSPVISLAATAGGGDHAEVLKRLVRLARRRGYAGEGVDGTFFYAALYDRNGIDPLRLSDTLSSLTSNLVASGIFFEDDPSRNSLVIFSVPSPEGRGPQLHLPYYLLPLPQTAVIDMLLGRLMIFNLVNSGRVVAALESAGFEVRVPTGRNDLSGDSLVVRMHVEGDRGERYAAEWRNLTMHLNEMTMEFKPVQYIVDIAEAMRKSVHLGVNHLRQRSAGRE